TACLPILLVLSFEIDQTPVQIDPAPFQRQHFARAYPGAQSQDDKVHQMRCHQTAVITTARRLGNTVIAARMFVRWCQENFFAYMRKHLDIDGLLEYGAEAIPGTLEVVNPAWRDLDQTVRQTRQKERKLQAKLAKLALGEGTEIQKNAESVESLQAVQAELEQLRAQRTLGSGATPPRPTRHAGRS
nr:hypothetical protein [Methylotetracoccus sp.]